MDKPSLFVGSSTEGIEFARAVRGRLDSDAEVHLWDEGFFLLGSTVVETLLASLPRFDFAALILTPDDLIMTRQREAFGPRDNVVFELGLFMGHLGRRRTFLVHQSNSHIKMPSDLAGVIMVGYEWPNPDNNPERAVGRACDSIRRQIKDQGAAEHNLARYLSWINWLSQRVLTPEQRASLRALESRSAFTVDLGKRPKLEQELRDLADLGLVARRDSKTIGSLFRGDPKQDVNSVLTITASGREYLKFYEASKNQNP
jgi:hypothetical protein